MCFYAIKKPDFAFVMKTMVHSVALILGRRIMTLTGDMMEFRMGSAVGAVTSIHMSASSVLLSAGVSASTDASGNIFHRASTDSKENV